MALVSCPDCGGLVSDNAEECPDCGRHMWASPRTHLASMGCFLLILVVLFFCCVGVVFLSLR